MLECLEIKNIMIRIINLVDGINGRIYLVKERIGELEGEVYELLECSIEWKKRERIKKD